MAKVKVAGTIFGVATLLGMAAPAHAGVLWSADWTAPKPNVISDTGNNQLLLAAGPHFDGNGNASNFLAGQFTVQTPFKGATDGWTSQNYSLQMLLTDKASHATKTLLFAGGLSGTATGSSSAITNEFVANKTSYDFTLGGHHYKVTLGPYVANGTGTNVGLVDAQVSVDGSTSPPPNETPEPSTLVLMGLGCCSAAAAAWRKRTSRTVTAPVV